MGGCAVLCSFGGWGGVVFVVLAVVFVVLNYLLLDEDGFSDNGDLFDFSYDDLVVM